MKTIQKNQATINIENLVKSKQYKDSSNEFKKTQLFIAKMNEIMEKKSLKQSEVASKMNISQSNLSRLLSGNRPTCSFETIIKFCDAVGVKLIIS